MYDADLEDIRFLMDTDLEKDSPHSNPDNLKALIYRIFAFIMLIST